MGGLKIDAEMLVPCPRCHIMAGKKCLDMRTLHGWTRYTKNYHVLRKQALREFVGSVAPKRRPGSGS